MWNLCGSCGKELVTIFFALCNVSIAQQVFLMLIHPAQLFVVAQYDFLIAIRFEIDAATLQLEITFNKKYCFICYFFILFIISTEVLFYKINLNKNLSSSSKQAVIIYLFFFIIFCILHLLLVREITQQWEFM